MHRATLTPVAFEANLYLAIREDKKCAGGINLRADLAKLSDADLTADLNHMIEYRSERCGTVPPIGSLRGFFRYGFAWWPGWRGPIRAHVYFYVPHPLEVHYAGRYGEVVSSSRRARRPTG